MRVTERPFSDLLRHPRQVAEEVQDSDVVLRRRDEPDLRLTLAEREAARARAFASLGRTLRNLALHHPKVLSGALADAFPWLEFLPQSDRELFVDEFSRLIAAAAELDNYAGLSQLVAEWRATAEVQADPRLARRLRRPVHAEGGPVQAPAV
jgi:hypothetical protein